MTQESSQQSFFKKIKESWTKEDTILVSVLVLGASLLLAVVLVTPVKELIITPVARLLGASDEKPSESKASKVKSSKLADRGIFQFGKMLVSLAKRDEYLDSDIDLEYDLGVLRVHVDGSIEDIKGANKFCEKNKNKMKDAIINSISLVSVEDIKTNHGMDDLKIILLEAINGAMESNRTIFTNIFFRKFLLMPSES